MSGATPEQPSRESELCQGSLPREDSLKVLLVEDLDDALAWTSRESPVGSSSLGSPGSARAEESSNPTTALLQSASRLYSVPDVGIFKELLDAELKRLRSFVMEHYAEMAQVSQEEKRTSSKNTRQASNEAQRGKNEASVPTGRLLETFASSASCLSNGSSSTLVPLLAQPRMTKTVGMAQVVEIHEACDHEAMGSEREESASPRAWAGPTGVGSASFVGFGRRKSFLSRVSQQFADGEFEAHEIWYEDVKICQLPGPGRELKSSFFIEDAVDSKKENNTMIRLLNIIVVQPNSIKRLCWDIFAIFFNFYDVIFMPLAFFNLTYSSHFSLFVMAWITRVFWTCDVPSSFLTGFVTVNGSMDMNVRTIARRFARGWMVFDVCLVLADWVEFLVESTFKGIKNVRLARSVRAVRMLRMLRLLRLIRMPKKVARIADRVVSDDAKVLGSMLKIVIGVLLLAHIFACVWYGIGHTGIGRSWLDAVHIQGRTDNPDLWSLYLVSLHWSLALITAGEITVQPQSQVEQLFTVVMSLFAFAIAACAVSLITSTMTRFDMLKSRETARFQLLRQYMVERKISPKLMARIQRNAAHAIREKRNNLSEANVELLKIVSEPLHIELHFEAYSPILSNHPFFAKYCRDNPAAVQQICHSALEIVGPYSNGDIIFNIGEVPEHPKTFFITSGSLAYYHSAHGFEELAEGNWLCEHSLWVPWRHCGTLKATSEEVRLLCLRTQSFQNVMKHFLSTSKHNDAILPGNYALEFVKLLNATSVMDLTDITTPEDCSQLVLSAYPAVRFNDSQQAGGSKRRGSLQSVEELKELLTDLRTRPRSWLRSWFRKMCCCCVWLKGEANTSRVIPRRVTGLLPMAGTGLPATLADEESDESDDSVSSDNSKDGTLSPKSPPAETPPVLTGDLGGDVAVLPNGLI